VAVAAGSVVTAIPGLGSILPTAPAGASENDATLSDAEISAASKVPLVAHVTDLREGKVTLYHGKRQLEFKNPAWVAQMYQNIPTQER
jgi:hypothetical protein